MRPLVFSTTHDSDRQSFPPIEDESRVRAIEFLVRNLPAGFLIAATAPRVDYLGAVIFIVDVTAREYD